MYYNFGFNVNYIDPEINKVTKAFKNHYKAPSNDYSSLHYRRQSLEEMQSLNWENASGIGAVLRFGKLRALDFDKCNDISLIYLILDKLGLPKNYEWVAKTGSGNGFHIYFLSEDHNYPIIDNKTKAFIPNEMNKNSFARVELRWNKHIVLPPSISSKYIFYSFLHESIPLKAPNYISIESIENLILLLCSNNAGLNTDLLNQNRNYEYYHGSYLDLEPIIFSQITDDYEDGCEDEVYDDYNSYDDYDNPPSVHSNIHYNDNLDMDQQSQDFWDSI